MANGPIDGRDLADAFSDVHLAVSPFSGAERSVDAGPGFDEVLRSFEALEVESDRIAALATSSRWQSPEMALVADETRRMAEDRRNAMILRRSPIPVSAKDGLRDFARGAVGFSVDAGRRMREVKDRVASFFSHGATVSCDGPDGSGIVAEFMGSLARNARYGAAGVVFVAGFTGSVPWPVGIDVDAAAGAAAHTPGEAIVALASLKVEEMWGEAAGERFWDDVEGFSDRCARAAGTPVDCRIETAVVSFDYGRDVYLVRDPADGSAIARQQDGEFQPLVDRTSRHSEDIAFARSMEALARDGFEFPTLDRLAQEAETAAREAEARQSDDSLGQSIVSITWRP